MRSSLPSRTSSLHGRDVRGPVKRASVPAGGAGGAGAATVSRRILSNARMVPCGSVRTHARRIVLPVPVQRPRRSRQAQARRRMRAHPGPPSQLARELTGHGKGAAPSGRRWRKTGHCAELYAGLSGSRIGAGTVPAPARSPCRLVRIRANNPTAHNRRDDPPCAPSRGDDRSSPRPDGEAHGSTAALVEGALGRTSVGTHACPGRRLSRRAARQAHQGTIRSHHDPCVGVTLVLVWTTASGVCCAARVRNRVSHTVDGRCGSEVDDPVVRAELIVLGVRDPDSVVHLTARDLLRGVRRLADAHDARDKTHRV